MANTTTSTNNKTPTMTTKPKQQPTPKIDTDDILLPYDDGEDGMINHSLNSFAAAFCCNPFDNMMPESLITLSQGQAFDGIIVQSATTGRLAASDVLIHFDHSTSPFPPTSSAASSSSSSSSSSTTTNECQALLEIDDATLGKVYFPIVHDAMKKKNRFGGRPSPKCDHMNDRRNNSDATSSSGNSRNHQSTTPTPATPPTPTTTTTNHNTELGSEEESLELLAKLLKPGKNTVRYLFRNQQRVLGVAHASIFLWGDQDRIVISDVDGTITKTNVRGIYDTIVTEKYSYCHDKVCAFLTSLKHNVEQQQQVDSTNANPQEQAINDNNNNNNNTTANKPKQIPKRQVHVVYVTSRPLFIASATRKFLSNLTQAKHGKNNNSNSNKKSSPSSSKNNNLSAEIQDLVEDQDQPHHQLPEGPLIGFAGRFMDVMKMELVSFTVHLFKASLLMDQIVTPFCQVSDEPHETHKSLFVAGFGNTLMDVQAYHMAGMDLSQIYLIDKKSRIACLDGDEIVTPPTPQPKTPSPPSASSRRGSSSSYFFSRKSSSLKRLSSGRSLTTSNSSSSSSSKQSASVTMASPTTATTTTTTTATVSNKSITIPEDILGGSNKFLLVDDAQPTAVTDARPMLKTPMSRKSYKQQLGTAFVGYHDERLTSHVFDISSEEQQRLKQLRVEPLKVV